MKPKLIALIALIMLAIVPAVSAYPIALSHVYDPVPATYNETQYIDVTYTMTAVTPGDDPCWDANQANVHWYWVDNTGIIRDRITSCDGAFTCSYWPNSSAYSGAYEMSMSIPGYYGGTCYTNAYLFNISETYIGGSSDRFVTAFNTNPDGWYSFTFAATPPVPPLGVSIFVDNTTGTIPFTTNLQGGTNAIGLTNWLWNVTGPGTPTTSSTSAQNITFSTSTPGSYTFKLTAWNATSIGDITRTNLITVSDPNSTTIRTYFQAVEGSSGGSVHGADIQIYDVEGNRWQNYTADSDGTGYIDAPSDHTLNGYAQYTGMVSTSRLGLEPFDGLYELVLWPSYMLGAPGSGDPGDPGVGNINLIVMVNDKITKENIEYASVSVTIPSGSTQGTSTGTTGNAIFVVPNNSVIYIKASADGYTTASTTITSSAMGPDTKRIELDKPTVTPSITATPLPGEATVRPTLDIRSPEQKDQAMMDLIRSNAELLISVAILMTLLYMMGYKP